MRPVGLVGLLIAFFASLALRLVARRLVNARLGVTHRGRVTAIDWRHELDPFGAVAALVLGTGWGRAATLDGLGTRGRRLAPVIAGILAPILVGELLLIAFRLLYGHTGSLAVADLMAASSDFGYPAQLLLTTAAGMIAFGALALIPLPPLDGFALLWHSMRRPGVTAAKIRHVLVDNNIGLVILLFMAIYPFGGSFLTLPLNLIALPLVLVAW